MSFVNCCEPNSLAWESCKYVPRTFTVTPLTDGRFTVHRARGDKRIFQAIFHAEELTNFLRADFVEQMISIQRSKETAHIEAEKRRARKTAPAKRAARPKLDLNSIDFSSLEL